MQGGPATQLLPSSTATPPLLPVAGSPATDSTGNFAGAATADAQGTILSLDEQNMAGSLDDAELMHLEEMVRLAKAQRGVQTAQPAASSEPEKAPQVNSKGEAPRAINEHPDALLK